MSTVYTVGTARRTLFVLDNYDSFTFNLVQYLGELCREHTRIAGRIVVERNDRISVSAVRRLRPSGILVSPGPCTPKEAGISVELIRAFAGVVPLLGVCLGHECIVAAWGGRIVRAPALYHGKTSQIHHDGRTIFSGLPDPFTATRYHSLVADPRTLPRALEVSARTADGVIMAVRVRGSAVPVEGVQFHPESVMTTEGKRLLLNFLRMTVGRAWEERRR